MDDSAYSQLLPSSSVLMLAGAAFVFYLASRIGVFALGDTALAEPDADASRDDRAGPATLAQWLPIAGVATLAVRDMPDVSISLIFGTSVACLALVLGTTLFASSPAGPLESRHRRAWGMVLPAAVLALMAGFAARFTLNHALVFALQGLAALFMWTARHDALGNAADSAAEPIRAPRAANSARRTVAVFAWLLLTLIGAAVALRSADRLTHEVPRLTGGTIAALMISPALVLPIIGSSLNFSRRGRADVAISCAVGCVLLNLCLLLPVVIVASSALGVWRSAGGSAESLLDTMRRDAGWLDAAINPPLTFPMAAWRIDTVLMIVLGAMLLVFSTGRWTPRRTEGLALLVAYVLYLGANAALAGR